MALGLHRHGDRVMAKLFLNMRWARVVHQEKGGVGVP